MSFEYHFVPASNIDAETLITTAACVETQIAAYAVNFNPNSDSANRNYHFIGNLRSNWPEDFTVSLGETECYLCFNSATGEQRSAIIHILTQCLHNAGLIGSFEEL